LGYLEGLGIVTIVRYYQEKKDMSQKNKMVRQKWGRHGTFWMCLKSKDLLEKMPLKLSMLIETNDKPMDLGGVAYRQIHEVGT